MPAFEHASDRASEDLPRSTPSTDSSTELTYSNISNPSAPPSKSVIYDLEDLFMVRSLPLGTGFALITCLKTFNSLQGLNIGDALTPLIKKHPNRPRYARPNTCNNQYRAEKSALGFIHVCG